METTPRIHVLVVEDSDDDAVLIIGELRRGGLEVSYDRVEEAETLAGQLRDHPPDLVISDYNIPGFGAEQALHLLHESGLDVPFILVSGQVGEETAAALMRAGAHDFLLKDHLTRLVPAVQRELRDAADRDRRRRADQERERLERQLRQSERLESLGRLAGGVAHDFNNLLAVISGYADMLTDALPVGDPRRPDAEEISNAADRAAALTRQLLIFSRMEPAKPETLDLNSVVTATEKLLRRTIGEDIEFTSALDPDVPPITADRGKIEQVIMNLVVNARGAMPHGGRLTIATSVSPRGDRPRSTPESGERDHLHLTVTDTGCGMTPEVAQHALEPFFTTKPPGEGTGLGLATVYGVVKEADGDLDIQSEVGKGTTIHVYLPATETTAAETRTPDQPPEGNGETILIVEDEDAVRDITGRILTRSGYRIMTAARPDEALERYSPPDVHIDALITDSVMPGMAGPQFIEHLRQTHPKLPALLMSGYSTGAPPTSPPPPEDLPLIRKPFKGHDLLERLHDLLHPTPAAGAAGPPAGRPRG